MVETNRAGQVFYPREADALVPEGCIAVGNEHGACLDRGCRWCLVYYNGPQALGEMQERFIDDLRHRVGQLPGVKRVEFFGSVVTPHFRPGQSDLDMVVEGAVSPQAKRQVVALIQDANQRHGLRLGEAPYLHPVPFFVTNRLSKALLVAMARGVSWGLASRLVYHWKARQQQHPTTLQEFWGGWRPGPGDLRYYVAKLWG